MQIIDPSVEAYAASHCATLDPVYEELRKETYDKTEWPAMQVGRIEGRLLKLLTQLCAARMAVEVGTFTGYSALSIAEGLTEDGKLVTCDVDEATNGIARRYFAKVSWGSRIETRLGKAIDTLRSIPGPIDFAFIDADKESYIEYWEELVPKMRSGGLIVADNVLWSGAVLSPSRESDHAIVAFNDHVARDDRVEQVVLTVRDGMTLARKV